MAVPKVVEVDTSTGAITSRALTDDEVAERQAQAEADQAAADATRRRQADRDAARDLLLDRARTGDPLADAVVKLLALDT